MEPATSIAKSASRLALVGAAALGFIGVAGGAFGAHVLKTHISPELLSAFETGARYAQLHTTALLAVGLWDRAWPTPGLRRVAILFLLGVALFTGSLWAMALTGVTRLGIVTPLGGLCFLTGWALLGRAAWRLGSGPAIRPDGPAPGNS